MVIPRPLRVLIVDDEPLGRQRLEDLVRKDPTIEIAGSAADGTAAVQAIRTLRPDLVFLDVQMPGMSGLDVIRELGPDEMPATVLVTAYDKHALEAYQLAAIDYIVKPFDDERFEEAVKRARRFSGVKDAQVLRDRLLALLSGNDGNDAPHGMPPGARNGWLERIAVETRGKVRYVQVRDVIYILSSGPYAELYLADRKHLVRVSMNTLEEQLDPARFMRVHRSAIVQLSMVEILHKGPGGDYEVQLRNGIRLNVSRTRREELERRLAAVP
jgi:two-component system LytT family response regulator